MAGGHFNITEPEALNALDLAADLVPAVDTFLPQSTSPPPQSTPPPIEVETTTLPEADVSEVASEADTSISYAASDAPEASTAVLPRLGAFNPAAYRAPRSRI